MKERLHKLMEAEGLSSARFADEIGVQRSSISHILSGRNKPSFDFIVKILSRFKGINADWLLTGQGNMIKGHENIGNNSFDLNTLFPEGNTVAAPISSPKREVSSHIKEPDVVKSEDSPEYISKAKIREGNSIKNKVTNVNSVKYILVFYEDGSFEQFRPRECAI